MQRLSGFGIYSLEEIFSRLSADESLSALPFIREIFHGFSSGADMKKQWECCVEAFCVSYADKKTGNQLISFSAAFGKLSYEEFGLLCEKYYSDFALMAEREQKNWEKNREITVYSGVLVAAAVFFIFM